MNVGYSPTNTEGAELLFQAIIDDCEKCSLIITTNGPFSGWGTVCGGNMPAPPQSTERFHG